MDPDTAADVPVRSHMDDPNTEWRHGKPIYDSINALYLNERLEKHELGSMEKTVENLVKTWEMELSHKKNPKQWQTVAYDKFRMQTNGGEPFSADDIAAKGSYNTLMADAPLYKASQETFESSHDDFRNAFPDGFAWEVLEVVSGPPVVTFTWRHWARWTGPYKGVPPSGERIEMKGCGIVKVNDQLQMEDLKIFYDPNPLLATLLKWNTDTRDDSTGCPIHK